MAFHQPNVAHENQLKPLKFQRFKQKDVQKANGISFWAFLVISIFIFISIFYIFNLSPSSLLYTTKFWFFISNALILIIAVDFGASNKQPEIYEEYVEKSMGNIIRFPSIESQYPEWEIAKTNNSPHPEKEIAKTNNPRPHPEKEIARTNIPIPPQKEENLLETQEEVKEVVVSESKTRENKMQVVVKDDLKMSIEEPEGKMVDFPPQVLDHEEVHKEEKERGTRIGNELNAKGGGGQQEEDKEHDDDDDDDDDDEFSKMSNEELNRRVEEFIQRFNRQIRIQAAQNRVQQMQRGN